MRRTVHGARRASRRKTGLLAPRILIECTPPMKTVCLILLLGLAACGGLDPVSRVTDSQAMLKMRFSNKTTDELKLRRGQIIEMLGLASTSVNPGSNNVTVGVNVGNSGGIDRGKAQELFEEKADIERELLRRWKAGDKAAHLNIFDS
jgi:hypothetical protein